MPRRERDTRRVKDRVPMRFTAGGKVYDWTYLSAMRGETLGLKRSRVNAFVVRRPGSYDLFRSQHMWPWLVTMDTQKNGFEQICLFCFHPFRSQRIPELPSKNRCSRPDQGRRTNSANRKSLQKAFFYRPTKTNCDGL